MPLGFHFTSRSLRGQTHETQVLEHILNETNELLANGTAAPVVWPEMLAGDKGYRAEWVDTFLLGLGIKPVIPSKSNEDRDKRAHKFDSDVYRRRNIVERLVGWLKENRRLFSRFEKSAKNFGGMIRLAFVRRYLRLMCG